MTDIREKLTAKALKLLSYRARSVAEIRSRLEKITPDQSLIDGVVNRLKGDGLLDDVSFARWWVKQRQSHRPRGNFGLTVELKKKGISEEIIDQVLPDAAEEKALAKKFISSRVRRLRGLTSLQKRQKISVFINNFRRNFLLGDFTKYAISFGVSHWKSISC